MSADAYFAASNLDENCDRCGLDIYVQAQIMLDAASESDEKLWAQVWDYVQALTYGLCTEPRLVVIDGGSQAWRF
ncbi:hypothetical protein [uncultured Roseobacter sp.]|uniref:hypothetical protein n=1 Tax=uncultured Roseobacter sp. TaxID=114847 RepID=UPI00262E122B|nr:hypothetical protein [uncultured Roseobacter sp.]